MNQLIRNTLRKGLYTSNIIRSFALKLGLIKTDLKSPHLGHLSLYNEYYLRGAAQKEETLFLFSIIKMVRPSIIVEFGFSRGHGSLNFLYAMDHDSKLYSYDISDIAKEIATSTFNDFTNFKYIHKSMLDFLPEDIDNNKIDFLYMDAVVDNDSLNFDTFEKILPNLSENAILAVHDSGTWQKKHFHEFHKEYTVKHGGKGWISDEEYQPRPNQRKFVNRVMEKYQDFEIIHLHSERTIRCGITLLQKRKFLKTASKENDQLTHELSLN